MISLPEGVHIADDAPCEISRALERFETEVHGQRDILAWRAYLTMVCRTPPEVQRYIAVIRRGEYAGQRRMIETTADLQAMRRALADALAIHITDIVMWRIQSP